MENQRFDEALEEPRLMLVDTNVLLDVIQDDATWADWSISQLRSQAKVHQLVINPVIYAEISLAFEQIETVDKVLEDMQLPMMELPKPALFLAAKAFLAYRRRGGLKRNVLSDFYIGAHAAVMDWPVLTRDRRKYETYFPVVKLIAP
jgi:predicted nucleic acid-binding protein